MQCFAYHRVMVVDLVILCLPMVTCQETPHHMLTATG